MNFKLKNLKRFQLELEVRVAGTLADSSRVLVDEASGYVIMRTESGQLE